MNEVVVDKELPEIIVNKRELAEGTIIKQNYIKVKGKTLKECKEIYDKIKNESA